MTKFLLLGGDVRRKHRGLRRIRQGASRSSRRGVEVRDNKTVRELVFRRALERESSWLATGCAHRARSRRVRESRHAKRAKRHQRRSEAAGRRQTFAFAALVLDARRRSGLRVDLLDRRRSVRRRYSGRDKCPQHRAGPELKSWRPESAHEWREARVAPSWRR